MLPTELLPLSAIEPEPVNVVTFGFSAMLAVTVGGGVPGELRVDAAVEALERERSCGPTRRRSRGGPLRAGTVQRVVKVALRRVGNHVRVARSASRRCTRASQNGASSKSANDSARPVCHTKPGFVIQ